MKKPIFYFFYDERDIKPGMASIKFLVRHDGKDKLIPTGNQITTKESEFLKTNKIELSRQTKSPDKIFLWNFVYGKTYIHPETGEEKLSLTSKANQIIEELGEDFSFNAFKEAYKNFGNKKTNVIAPETNEPVGANVFDLMLTTSNRLDNLERHGSASLYRDAMNSIRRFVGKDHLGWNEVNADFLARYELFMRKEGKAPRSKEGKPSPASPTTIGIYLRNLRACFNEAIEDGLTPESSYPFKKKKYVIPTGPKKKKDITTEDIERIIECKCSSEHEKRSRDFWVLSYLSNGANFSDLLRLTNNSLTEDGFDFTRRKTRLTKKNDPGVISVFLDKTGLEIIKRWRRKTPDKNCDLVFPFLSGLEELERIKAIKQFIKTTNKYMKRIGENLSIDINLTTYVARHSFGTAMMSSGQPMIMVSQMLGHSSVSTTQQYFGGFERARLKGAVSALRVSKSND